ncbi:hypothetical protein GQ53DRAFT_746356 [Thozetella sp. PMI_491]|nr:hypothetical protein GQ53DRAFT_746356 [Thozetella sp. PMI_491]
MTLAIFLVDSNAAVRHGNTVDPVHPTRPRHSPKPAEESEMARCDEPRPLPRLERHAACPSFREPQLSDLRSQCFFTSPVPSPATAHACPPRIQWRGNVDMSGLSVTIQPAMGDFSRWTY